MNHAELDPPVGVADGAHWGSLHDAWQTAVVVVAHGARSQREPLPSAVIIAIIEHRVEANRTPDDMVDAEPGQRRRVTSLRPHPRDARGRNWDIQTLDARKHVVPGGVAELRRMVDDLRDQFDLV